MGRYAMVQEADAKNLLDVIRESDYINPDICVEILARTPREGSLLPWAGLAEDRMPLADILKDMHREQAIEALYNKGAALEDELRQFREQLFADRIEYLAEHNIAWGPIEFHSNDPASVREEARLYRQCIEVYLNRTNKYDPDFELTRGDLEYVEILAGKIGCGFPGLGLSERYDREVLETQVEIYCRGFEDIAEEYGLTAEEHAAKARKAKQEIEHLYPLSE
jgi:hypothetical protein